MRAGHVRLVLVAACLAAQRLVHAAVGVIAAACDRLFREAICFPDRRCVFPTGTACGGHVGLCAERCSISADDVTAHLAEAVHSRRI